MDFLRDRLHTDSEDLRELGSVQAWGGGVLWAIGQFLHRFLCQTRSFSPIPSLSSLFDSHFVSFHAFRRDQTFHNLWSPRTIEAKSPMTTGFFICEKFEFVVFFVLSLQHKMKFG
jgi:hypothetical protein